MRLWSQSLILVVLLALFLFAGCSEDVGESHRTFTFTDDRRKEVVLPRPVTKVISLAPSFTEIVYALGAEEKLIGVTTYCDYPQEATLKPKVGDFLNPSIERIIAMKPDCVLATAPSQARIIDRLEKLGLKVIQLNPESILGVERCITQIGEILDRRDSADSLVGQFRGSIRRLRKLTSSIENKKRVFLEIDTNPLVSPGPASFVGELLALAGGVNIVQSGSKYPVVNPEFVIKEDPEVIIIANPAVLPDEVKSRLGWGPVSAVRWGRVYSIDAGEISRPGPRAVKGAEELFRLIYQTGEELESEGGK